MLRNIRIGTRLVISFLVIVTVMVAAAGITNYSSFAEAESAAVQTSLGIMEEKIGVIVENIQDQHEKMSSDLVLVVHNPIFKEYFELPDTRAGNKYSEEGVMLFSPVQQVLKEEIEDWTHYVQSRFPIGETCLIDKVGQEHTRLVLNKVAPDDELSSHENEAPFFVPSLNLREDQVHIEYPYMSEDSFTWVFS